MFTPPRTLTAKPIYARPGCLQASWSSARTTTAGYITLSAPSVASSPAASSTCGHIAQMLNYSINTIYAYRNRMKSYAIDRDVFESRIMEIPSV